MSSCKPWLLVLVALTSFPAQAVVGGGYVLGITGEADNAGGRAISGFVDYGFTQQTWLSAAIARTSTDAAIGGLDTVYADLGLEHSFGLAGIRASAAYWGNDEIIDSVDLRAGLFFSGKKGSLSFDYERRDFDFTFRPALQPDRVRMAEFHASGFGMAASLQAGESRRLFASGMSYNYSRNIRLQPSIDSLRPLSLSRLSLINSLIDYRLGGGIEFRFGKRSLDFTVSHWQTAIDSGSVNSIAVGFITPTSPASDIEIRLALDRSENFGDTLALAITLYYFGG